MKDLLPVCPYLAVPFDEAKVKAFYMEQLIVFKYK